MESRPFQPISSIADVEYNEEIRLEDRKLPPNTYEIFKRTGLQYGNKIALRFLLQGTEKKEQAVNYDYVDLLKHISQTATALQNLDVGKDDAVTILLPNLPQNHFTLWGAEAIGIASPINPLLSPSHIKSIMNQTKSKVLVTLAPFPNTDLWDKVQSIVNDVPSLKSILTVDMRQFLPESHRPPHQPLPEKINDVLIYDFDHYIAKYVDQIEVECKKEWEDTAAYFHTGGTTGLPKIAMQSHRNQVFSAWMVGQQLAWTKNDVMHCGLPMFHVNAPLISGLAPFMVGGEVIMTSPQGFRNKAVLDHFADLIRDYSISFFMGVPTIFTELNNRWEGRDDIHTLTSLRFAACGAAPLPPAFISKFKGITQALQNFTVLEGYGLTEGTVFSTATPPFAKHAMPNSIGIRIPYQQLEIAELDKNGKAKLDESGNVVCLGANETGTIIIRGPNVFQGYLNEKDNETAWVDQPGGWLNTGDLAKKNEEGYLFLIGRAKDLIIRGGHNINPQLIEEPLSKHPDVALVAAIGKPDKRAVELPMAYVQLTPDAKTNYNKLNPDARKKYLADLFTYASENISERAAVPHQIKIIDAIPMTAVGKIFNPALRNEATKQIIEEELSTLKALGTAFQISVDHDPTKGLIATITVDDNVKDEAIKKMQSRLENYAFKIEFKRNGECIDLTDTSKNQRVLTPNSELSSTGT